ncbi:hypothetical protein [Pseudomonas peli]|uniref:hypothetical protein n=1 Tax=Pseudomonas peli TaxID=592361 RepID=UPI0024ADA9B3|nr:hypothetical protein [Pseudomonas peli]
MTAIWPGAAWRCCTWLFSTSARARLPMYAAEPDSETATFFIGTGGGYGQTKTKRDLITCAEGLHRRSLPRNSTLPTRASVSFIRWL